jgi:ketosteroid isomerase-like protein
MLGGAAIAMADDKADVLAANKAFEQAFSRRDLNAIAATWAHDGNVSVIHPSSKNVVIGWDEVRKTWEMTLNAFKELNLTMEDARANVDGNTAWVVGTEKLRGQRPNGDPVELVVLTTNVYRKIGDHWLMVHHHGNRPPQ